MTKPTVLSRGHGRRALCIPWLLSSFAAVRVATDKIVYNEGKYDTFLAIFTAMLSWSWIYFGLSHVWSALALDNGLATTPPMGWNPYNAFLCTTTESQYRAAAQSLVSLGLKDLGYKYVNLDCGWQGKTRNSTGGFTWDTTTIPSGIPALSSFIHGLGLNFGVYSDGGVFACDFVGGNAHYLGSLSHETDDAATFASWGADYLKYDNCYAVNSTDFVDFNPPISIEAHYVTMRDALAATKRPIVFSICEWGVQDPARWPASSVGNSWRISNDIGPPPSWDNFLESSTNWCLSRNSPNGEDGMQDPLGASINFKRRYTNDHDVWAGPLADGSTVAVIINWQNTSRSLTVNLADVGFSSATATDLITGSSLGKVKESVTATVAAHGCVVLKLTGGVSSPAPAITFYDAAASTSTLSGGANTRVVNSTITVVGFVGEGGTLSFNNVDGGALGGTKLLSFDYINGDFVFSNTDCSNCRNAFISVNGGTPVQAQMPISAQSWDILFSGYLVSLPGFNPGKANTVQISNPSGFTPDFYRLGVSV
ncbi:glycoside hydrolase superfamily [Flammula alnicola]|nr:glycoside hydrolase superfamily [Flammula alnicola]